MFTHTADLESSLSQKPPLMIKPRIASNNKSTYVSKGHVEPKSSCAMSFLLIMFLGVFASVAHSQCTTIPSFSCGELTNLTYPFLTKSQQQQINCSGSEFELLYCGTKRELLNIQDQELRVIHISLEKRTMRLSLTVDYPCVPAQSPLDGNMTKLQPPTSIFIFYDCSSPGEELPTCRSGKHDWVYWGTETYRPPQNIVNSCKKHFDVMNGTTLDDIRSSTNLTELRDKLLTALHTGFEVSISPPPPPPPSPSPTPTPSPSPSPSPSPLPPRYDGEPETGRSDINSILLIGFCVSGGTALIMSALFFIYRRFRKATDTRLSHYTRNLSSDPPSISDPEKMGALYGIKFFMYDELKEATDNFSESREIGDGGFGTVYVGTLLDGRTVAVKRLYENNYKRVEQFLNEVDILARLRHKNLVTLYGCTSRHSRELLLVYEYISNGTVADHLHGENPRSGSLSWQARLKIAVETASALKYLHASDIIHRDVKTNNILLDENFNVKVADFGLSRLFPLDVTHVSTAPQGTPGYVDPEYHQCYQLTDKSDVYSFGVVLVELISSKPAVDITRQHHEINLSNMAINKIKNGALHELVDSSLGFDRDSNVHKMITAVAELAFQCLQSNQDSRPSMEQVLEILTRIQCGYSQTEEDLDIYSDEFVLLKNSSLPLSSDSMAAK